MHLDSGRVKDIQMLEAKLKLVQSPTERRDITRAINAIKRQAENTQLTRDRERLLQARRNTVNAKGEINIKNERIAADKLEEQIRYTSGA